MILRQPLLSGLVFWMCLVPALGQTTRLVASGDRWMLPPGGGELAPGGGELGGPGLERRREEKVLPSVRFAAVPLDNVLDLLQELDEDFQAVVARPKEVPADYPVVPPMRLRNTTAESVARLLAVVFKDSVRHDVIADERRNKIHVFRLIVPEDIQLRLRRDGAGPKVHVFRLRETVDANLAIDGGDEEAAAQRRKVALSRVLSLIKAALDQAEGSAPPVIQLHEETETLILKGTGDQASLVDSALGALKPSVSSLVAKLKRELAALEDELRVREQALRAKEIEAVQAITTSEQRLAKLRDDMNVLKQLLRQREALIVKLEEQLAEAKAAAAPQPPSSQPAP